MLYGTLREARSCCRQERAFFYEKKSGNPAAPQNIYEQDKTILLNDGAYKIFFNSRLYDKAETAEEKYFFTFLMTGKPKSRFTTRLMDLVTSAKHNAQ